MNIRFARINEIEEIRVLIELSTSNLQAGFYRSEIIGEALELVSGIKKMVIERKLFIAEVSGSIVAIGGYKHLQGSNEAELKAFFVHPGHARQGVASEILNKCVAQLKLEKVKRLFLVATLAGEPFYIKHGFKESNRESVTLSSGSKFEVVHMKKTL
ncbi:GNAT family N-acetyltransferase [Halothiobacillus diazotrophicus]|uniref:GNAT family N-acetyltransferase n=1 Tax=Halothiobacillus diazotrophicus TaxID=1860122 RepID=UPI0009EEAC1A|nr:GNAT family N-acetyltransferase [Halothiobacillus diazotrophicus]